MSGRLSRNLKRLESEAIEVMREVVAEFRKIVHVNREGVVRGVDPIRSDAAQYILAEEIPVVPLYFAAPRPVVRRAGALIMVDDDRLPLEPGERPELLRVRFRTLGCYPLSGAIESDAQSGPRRIRSARRGWSISITAHRWNARSAKATSDG